MYNIWIVVLFTVMILGISAFYLFREKKIQILVQNYDHKKSFVLGTFNVDSYSKSDSSYFYNEPKATFGFNSQSDESDFIHKIVTSENYFGKMNGLSGSKFDDSNYLFRNDDSFYVLYKNKANRFVIKPIYSIFTFDQDSEYNQYRFVCPLDTVFDNQDKTKGNHSMSEKQFFTFYEALSDEVVKIDYENKTVHVQAFDIFNSKLSDNYPISITFTDGTLEVSLHNRQNSPGVVS